MVTNRIHGVFRVRVRRCYILISLAYLFQFFAESRWQCPGFGRGWMELVCTVLRTREVSSKKFLGVAKKSRRKR